MECKEEKAEKNHVRRREHANNCMESANEEVEALEGISLNTWQCIKGHGSHTETRNIFKSASFFLFSPYGLSV